VSKAGKRSGAAVEDQAARVRAAQYVRMSTEHQKYSTENQADAIAAYAARRGYDVVRTYEDAGKSGLRLDGRDSLKLLISDVTSGKADFSVILVYDVSRWGRFQDADQSAYYEFICREAGVAVQYCAEQFENDGSISATIIKSMKRAMAGEYSRELSSKVFAGQCRLIRLGYRQGGAAGFGLRRQLVDEHGNPKANLSRGEQKSLQTDRVVLIAGPDEEVCTVRRIYDLFVTYGRSEREIAVVLNEDGIATDLGRPWTRATVHQVLTNEKYAGHNVFNRVSFKLKQKRVVNPPDLLVRRDDAFPAIVMKEVFEAAQQIVLARSRRYSDDEMLALLSELFRQRGVLSGLVIDEIDAMPSSSAYRNRFGSLIRAYQLVGYSPDRDCSYIEINRALREFHAEAVKETIAAIERVGASITRNSETDLLTVNDEFTVSVVVARSLQTKTGAMRWKIRLETGMRPDLTIAIRMNDRNDKALDYYVLPWIDVGAAAQLRLSEDNGIFLDGYRYDALDDVFWLARRVKIARAA